jgi:hypothetical protein
MFDIIKGGPWGRSTTVFFSKSFGLGVSKKENFICLSSDPYKASVLSGFFQGASMTYASDDPTHEYHDHIFKDVRWYSANEANCQKALAMCVMRDEDRLAIMLHLEEQRILRESFDDFNELKSNLDDARNHGVLLASPMHRTPFEYAEAMVKGKRASVRKEKQSVVRKRKVPKWVPPTLQMRQRGITTNQRVLVEEEYLDEEVVEVPCEEVFEGMQQIKRANLLHWYKWSKSLVPFSAQIIGAEMCYLNKRMPLWYTMRVGKTQTCIITAKRLLAERKIDNVVVVTPVGSLYTTWSKGFLAEDMDHTILDGTQADDAEAMSQAPTISMVGYERLSSRHNMIASNIDLTRTLVICDETYAVKTHDSSRSRGARDFCRWADRVIILNGTPVEEGPQHLWGQMALVDPTGYNFWISFEDYARQNLELVGNGKWVASNKDAFQMLMDRTGLRWTAGESDQFRGGKDRTMKPHRIPPTKHMIDQIKNVMMGFIKIDKDNVAEISKNQLAMFSYIREILCGTDKWKTATGMVRRTQDVDPKIVFLQCLLESLGTTPLLIFSEYNHQEQRIMKLLDDMGISWAGSRERGTPQEMWRVKEGVWGATDNLCQILDYVSSRLDSYNQDLDEEDCVTDEIEDENTFRYHPLVVDWFLNYEPYNAESYTAITTGRKLPPKEKAEAIRQFQEGEVRCFLLKTSEGKSITLNRVPAMAAGISEQPEVIFMAPGWEFGLWDQALARTMGNDPKTGLPINTLVHVLIIGASLEADMLKALQQKKSFQDYACRDLDRQGAVNMVQDMIDNMEGYEGDYFDQKEFMARALCGITPYGRLTSNVIATKARKKYGLEGKKNEAAWAEFLDNNPDVKEAQAYLLRSL